MPDEELVVLLRTVRVAGRPRLRSIWSFTLALMLVTLLMLSVVDEFGDRVDQQRRAQIMLAELESDAAETQRALADVMLTPMASPGTLAELADEQEDVQENIDELAPLVEEPADLAGLQVSLDDLRAALDAQVAMVRSEDADAARAAHGGVTFEAFETFDDALGDVSDRYEEQSARMTGYGHVVLWSAVLLAWAAIVGLAWRHERTRRTAQARLEASRERFRTLAESAFEGVAVTRHGRIVEASEALASILGYGVEEMPGLNVVDLVEARSREQMRTSVAAGNEDQLEADAVRKDGSLVAVEVRTRPTTYRGEPLQVTAFRDVTERKALEEQLRHQALHDALTGLSNRTLFGDRLRHALVRTRDEQAPSVAVLLLDLDDFKVVNDSLGHAAGDEMLTVAAARLTGCVRPQDTVARLGGDEFAVLLENIADETEAVAAAERILRVFKATPAELADQHPVFLSASVGIALGVPGVHSPAEVLRDADLAMYEAKAQGKGRPSVFQPGMEVRVHERMQLENDLRHAVDGGQLEVHYQPQVEMGDGHVRGVEALVRWNHPTRGRIPPVEFIPIAERSGLIIPVGQWVLDRACADVARWQRSCPGAEELAVSVNLSVHQLHEPGLVEAVTTTLATSGLAARHLTLEITESALLSDTRVVATTLAQLRRLGVRLAIDDFGTGYSSLSYLKHLNSDYLKIDKSFVDELAHSPDDQGIIRSIIAMAETLGITCVAEGVEDPEQSEVLRRLGCELAQGYHFHRPAPAEDVEALLRAVDWRGTTAA